MIDHQHRFSLRRLIARLTGVYALGLLVFMIFRWIFEDSVWWLALLGNFTPLYFTALIGVLPLAVIARARRSVLLLLPSALIGLLVYGRLYWPKAKPRPPKTPPFRLITFNIWADNHDMTRIEGWLKAQQADLVITVELPPAWAEGEGIPALKETYPHQSKHIGAWTYWGSTVLSPHPFISTEIFTLNEMPQQRIVIEIGGQPVAIYAIHLNVPIGETNHLPLRLNSFVPNMFLRYDGANREAQIDALIERLKSEPLPYIVAGDFNLSDQSAGYPRLAALMGDSFREVGTGLGTSWPVLQAYGLPALLPPAIRIDYIWHNERVRVLQAEQGPFLGSDHLPLAATLALQ